MHVRLFEYFQGLSIVAHMHVQCHTGYMAPVVQWFICNGLWDYVPAAECGEHMKCSECSKGQCGCMWGLHDNRHWCTSTCLHSGAIWDGFIDRHTFKFFTDGLSQLDSIQWRNILLLAAEQLVERDIDLSIPKEKPKKKKYKQKPKKKHAPPQ